MPAAPVSASRLAILAEQPTVLDFFARDGNPAALHGHANTARVTRKGAGMQSLSEQQLAPFSHEIAVDIVGSSGVDQARL